MKTLKIHASDFGYRTKCGLHLDNSRNITRYEPSRITCNRPACAAVKKAG